MKRSLLLATSVAVVVLFLIGTVRAVMVDVYVDPKKYTLETQQPSQSGVIEEL